jgi:hypothetical protein
MKLYTEEQVKKAIDFFLSDETQKDKILETLTPIELPSDDDIKHCIGSVNYTEYDNGFIQGIKWMKEQILNQNK